MSMAKTLKELTAKEVLALAIQSEEEDGRIYADLAERVRGDYPETAKSLKPRPCATRRTGPSAPAHRDVPGKVRRAHPAHPPPRRERLLHAKAGLAQQRHHRADDPREIERWSSRRKVSTPPPSRRPATRPCASCSATSPPRRAKHYEIAEEMDEARSNPARARKEDDSVKRKFVLQIIQPGLAGLMDGSVSTLAPVFAAAFATHNSWTAFLVGIAASVGAGISMGFAEALSDDGVLSGRGNPWLRGPICGP
jgi:rubrerythrin